MLLLPLLLLLVCFAIVATCVSGLLLVFHQADGAGYPVMDLGHVMTALNKLDAADDEKIVLASRDGKSIMVVSYADVARSLENAFQELCARSTPPETLQYM
jgi:PAB-dependent poly(A)-specific ribonuclease subunit 3